jgi:lipoprotein signal peptidase
LPEVLILSASLSNLFDRIFYGGVLDFINIKVISGYSFPIGNLADILIVCSVTWLIIDLMFLEKYNARKMLYE